MFRRKFRFGGCADGRDAVRVGPGELYEPGRGYGFVTEKNRREQELLQLPELNAGWETWYWLRGQELSLVEQDGRGCFLDSSRAAAYLEEQDGCRTQGENRYIPLCFKVDVPRHGNYRVTLTIETEEPMEEVLIFAGRRKLALRGSIPAGGRLEHTMVVNVCDIIPRGKKQVYEDLSVDISVAAKLPRMTCLTIEEYACPTIYIAGDSTVTDQSASYPYSPGTSYSGWGQMLACFLDGRIAVSNYAHSGLTTESFRSEGHYAVADQYRKAGDYCFFQFGHNDQKLMELKAFGGYRRNLLRYIQESRERHCFPVLITPIARNSWKGNGEGYNDLLEEYAEACIQVGKETDTPVLDLHQRSVEFIKRKGLEGAKPYFYPGDFTHNDDYGAYLAAEFVAQEILRVCGGKEGGKKDRPYGRTIPSAASAGRFLADCVTEGFGQWQPPEGICLPQKPAAYDGICDPDGAGELFADLERPEEALTRAEALDMLIQTVKFFPTNVYNDMYDDVAGHEWYAGTVECACQNGMIPTELVENGRLFPERTVTLEEFLMFAVSAYRSRRKLPAAAREKNPYEGKCSRYALPYIALACTAGLVAQDGSQELTHTLTRREAAGICRFMKV